MKKLTTLTGPSCSGKSTLEKMMVERGCMKAVSTTTRAPRAGEVDGVDYYFISQDKFRAMDEVGMFIESVKFGDHFYAVSVAELERLYALGQHVVLVCEPGGARQIQKWAKTRPDIILTSVFVDNSPSVITDRFLRRFVADIVSQCALASSEKFEKAVDAYSKRLAIMMQTEPTWRIAAYSPTFAEIKYDLVFEKFDESNDEQVANILCDVPVVLT